VVGDRSRRFRSLAQKLVAAVSGEEIVDAGGYHADGPTTAMRRLTVWPYRDEATPSTALTIPS
jgi:hypothetical protein